MSTVISQLGFCGIKPMDLHGRQVHGLFYRSATSAQGQGFAGEAASEVTAWVSPARVRPANVASQHVGIRVAA